MRATSFALLSLLTGCPDRTVTGVTPVQGKVESKDIPAFPKRDIDILFVIDDSLSMKEEQDSLRANFSRFIDVLQSLDGGLPNVQIGVVTPNLGTTAIDGTKALSLGTCTDTGGERGELRPFGTGGPRFLRDVAKPGGGRDINYTGTLAQAFSQIATVGTNGCGIEQHLEAAKRALDGNAVNTGFLRPDAYLAVIVIADEDDCSLAKSSLFDGNRGDAAYPDVTNFRCTSHGVECEVPVTPFDQATGIRQDCHSKEDSDFIAPVARYVEFFKKIKRDPRDVIMAGIVGDPTPFEIIKKPGTTTTVLKRSCTYNSTSGEQFAFPAVRTAELLDQFPLNARATICAADLSDALTQIGVRLKQAIVEPCFEFPLADASPADGAQYDCSVTEVRRHPEAPDEEVRVLPACDGSAMPCWHIVEDAVACSYTKTNPHLKLVIDRAVPAEQDIRVKASCVTAEASGPPL